MFGGILMPEFEEKDLEIQMKSFMQLFNTYLEQYSVHQDSIFKLSSIKKGIINHYDNQDEPIMKTNGIIIRTKIEETYDFTEEIYDFLEDHGFLPLVTTIDKKTEKYFNVDHIKQNPVQSVRLYTGGRSLVNKELLHRKYQHLETEKLDNLTDSFKSAYTTSKLEEAKLTNLKQQLLEIMPTDSISIPNIGTMKKVTTYEYNSSDVFNSLTARKEAFIKPATNEDHFNVVIYPDDESQLSLHKNTTLGKHSLHNLYESADPLASSSFIKKSDYNKLIKQGYKAIAFETSADPYEFFRTCKISKSKINDLIQEGLLSKKDIEPFIIKGETREYQEVLTEGAVEMQRKIFDEKTMKQSQKLRERNDPNFQPSNLSSQTDLPIIDFSDFSF